jgi:hypothetical protein
MILQSLITIDSILMFLQMGSLLQQPVQRAGAFAQPVPGVHPHLAAHMAAAVGERP